MRNRLLYAALMVSLCCSAPCGQAAEPRPLAPLDLTAKIDPHARALLDDKLAVGFVIGVYKDGQTQILAYGEKTQGAGAAPDGDTAYEIGSVTKVFTGVLLADLVERGLVQIDDPLQQYLPADVKLPVAGAEPITLELLSTQRSGLPRLPGNMRPADPENPYADYTVEQMMTFLRSLQVAPPQADYSLERVMALLRGTQYTKPPGKYEYSNLGVGLLGHALASRADVSYEQLLRDRVTGPLEMSDTRITLDAALAERMATPYDAALRETKRWDIPTLAGAGAIRSTARDMLKFVRANLSDDPNQPLAAALRLAQQKRHDIDNGLAIGLGWHIARDQKTRWHNGMTGGFSSWLAVVPSAGVGVVVLANTATFEITPFGERMTQIALGMNPKPPARRATIAVDSAVLATYVGRYALTPTFHLTVTLEDGQLMAQATGQGKTPVFASAPGKFFYKVVDAQLTFVADGDGKVKKLVLHQNGRDIEGLRND